jgi:hypothetical protein
MKTARVVCVSAEIRISSLRNVICVTGLAMLLGMWFKLEKYGCLVDL